MIPQNMQLLKNCRSALIKISRPLKNKLFFNISLPVKIQLAVSMTFLALYSQGQTNSETRYPVFRNLYTDSWVATDALGRKLPTFEECGPVKKDRYVGMFYFMTHINPGGNGPFDVTKIMKANPENPQWGNGSHYWGEPETGYYLSNEKWMIRMKSLPERKTMTWYFRMKSAISYPSGKAGPGHRCPGIKAVSMEKTNGLG